MGHHLFKLLRSLEKMPVLVNTLSPRLDLNRIPLHIPSTLTNHQECREVVKPLVLYHSQINETFFRTFTLNSCFITFLKYDLYILIISFIFHFSKKNVPINCFQNMVILRLPRLQMEPDQIKTPPCHLRVLGLPAPPAVAKWNLKF